MNLKFWAAALIPAALSSCGLFEWTTYSRPGGAGRGGSTGAAKAVSYDDLPAWKEDDHRYALAAFRNTCKAKLQMTGEVRPDERLVGEKCRSLPSKSASAETARKWFEAHFAPYKVSDDATKDGKFTGYYSPIVKACRRQTAECSAPIMNKPADGRAFKGVPAKTIVDNKIGEVLYWIDPIDLHDMGSATLLLDDGTKAKLSVATTNDMPFNGISSQLLERGIRPEGGHGMKSVRAYLKKNRALANELIDNNPRYVYYAPSATDAVVGNMGVPLTGIRSVAIDKNIYTLGMPVYVDTKLTNGKDFRRLMVAQDTGGAIIGYNRADIYFGVGAEAFEYAHGQNQGGQMYILLPKEYEN
ncbi:MAG: MltA domain-containing protein [Rickettsiales bacterium]|jgi:membrane-bound lytic murein transglycosylase A|nr:MltA domain-containing protein [Rickettsiales bacterium]